ncbi:MAG: Ig-like domain-containing protein [Bacilli bacterium]
MKKWITLTLVLILAFVFVGCKPDDEDEDPDVVNATAVTITGAKAEIAIDEEMQLSATITPAEAVQTVNWSSKNTAIATVDNTGKVKGLTAGTAEIVAAAASNSKIFKSIQVTVKAPVVVVDPTSVTLTGTKTEVTMGSNITLVATVLPEGAAQEVTFSSSDEAIATVTSAGKVNGVALGTVTITVTVVADQTLTATYQVTVIEENIPDPEDKPTDIVIQGEAQMQAETQISLVASVLPTGVNQNVTWTSSNEAIATVSATGEVDAKAEGTVYITATSVADTNISAMHKIVVKPAPVVEPYPDLGGYQIKIMAAGHAMFEHDPFLELYTASDKTAKQTAWLDIESKFNCDLAVVPFPDVAPWGPSRYNWLNEKAALNAAETDIFVSTTDWLKVLADGGSIVDTTEYYNTYGQNQMSPAMKAASTYKGGLYSLPTVATAGLQVDSGIFYNVAFVERLGLTSPAKLFNDGDWTYTGFSNWVKEADALLASDESVLSGRPFIYWQGMVNAGGVKLADTLTMTTNLKHSYSMTAASILKELYALGWGTNAWDAGATTFNEGKSLMQGGSLWFVRTDNRWPATLWDAGGNSRFGYVPFPYPDSVTLENTRIGNVGGACYMQAAARPYPAGVTAKDVYRAFTEMMLETTKLVKEDPTYSEEGIMTTAAEKKIDDPESVKALVFFKRDKVIFDPLWVLLADSVAIGPAIDRIVTQGVDFNEEMDSQTSTYTARLLEVYG